MNKRLFLFCLLFPFLSNISVAQTVSISGKVLRHNGEALEGVTVSCTTADSVLTGPDGSFTFSNLLIGGDYTINGAYETNAFEGVTVLDAVFIRHMILFIIQASDFHWISADVNESGSVTGYDMILQRWGTLKKEESIPEAYWRFFDSESSMNIIETGISLDNLQSDTTNLELIAVKSGDVTFEADHSPPPPTASYPEFYVKDTLVMQDSVFSVEIKVRDFRQIVGFQHNVNWDTTAIEFIEMQESQGLYFIEANEEVLDQGILPVFGQDWNSIISGDNLEDDSTLYILQFRALQGVSSLESVFDFTESFIPHQALYYEDLEIYVVDQSYTFEEQPNAVKEISNLNLFKIMPNPSPDEVIVEIQFENTEEGILELYNLNGRMILTKNISGKNIIEALYLRSLEAGTYLLKLRTDNGISTQKLMKL